MEEDLGGQLLTRMEAQEHRGLHATGRGEGALGWNRIWQSNMLGILVFVSKQK